ncbi:MAG: hypothetical protein ABRQ39_15490 [Candidatus Eremiobacterota bacterium]
MLGASKYLEIVKKRGLEGKELARVHRIIRKESVLLQAYTNIYSNKGATTPGISKEDVIDGMNLDRIKTLSEDLRSGKFKWKPVERIHIPKKNGKKRHLGIIAVMTNWFKKQ